MAALQIRARRLALEAQVDQLPVKQELVCDAQIHNAERISFSKFVFTAAAVIDAQILGDQLFKTELNVHHGEAVSDLRKLRNQILIDLRHRLRLKIDPLLN